MATSLNKVTLIGNVGRDPEVRTTQGGKKVVTFTLATSESWKDKSTGAMQERTEWHRIVIFNQALADICEKYLRKGAKVYVEATLHTRKWVDQGGIERYTTEVVLQPYYGVLMMLDKKTGGESFSAPMSGGQPGADQPSYNIQELDDEIPF